MGGVFALSAVESDAARGAVGSSGGVRAAVFRACVARANGAHRPHETAGRARSHPDRCAAQAGVRGMAVRRRVSAAFQAARHIDRRRDRNRGRWAGHWPNDRRGSVDSDGRSAGRGHRERVACQFCDCVSQLPPDDVHPARWAAPISRVRCEHQGDRSGTETGRCAVVAQSATCLGHRPARRRPGKARRRGIDGARERSGRIGANR